MHNFQATRVGEAAQRRIDIPRIKLDCGSAPAGLVGGDQCRPRTRAGIEDEVAAVRAIEQKIGDQCSGLDRAGGDGAVRQG